jgi:hypothetical protein
MMEPSKERRLDDAAVGVGGLSGAGRDLLREPLVRALGVEVGGVLGEHALEVTLAENEEVVETLAADAAEEPVADGIGARRLDRGADHSDADPGGDPVEEFAELGVPVPNQYASLCAELTVGPEASPLIRKLYGVSSDAELRLLHEHWRTRLATHPDERAVFEQKLQAFTAFVRSRPR